MTAVKKIETTVAMVNYFRQYQLNFSEIEDFFLL